MTIVEHLRVRHMNLDLHRVWIDELEGVATFPLWNLSGQLSGYQQYRPNGDKKAFNHPKDGKYFTYRKNLIIGVWGLESWSLSNTLFITEGIFDACRLTNRGASAIALASNDPDKSTSKWLWTVKQFRKVVAVCDNDAAGIKLTKHAHEYIITKEHDLGDSSEDYVTKVLKMYT